MRSSKASPLRRVVWEKAGRARSRRARRSFMEGRKTIRRRARQHEREAPWSAVACHRRGGGGGSWWLGEPSRRPKLASAGLLFAVYRGGPPRPASRRLHKALASQRTPRT